MRRWISSRQFSVLSPYIALVSIVLMVSILVVQWNIQEDPQAKYVGSDKAEPLVPLAGVPELDENTQEFNLQASAITHAKECFPIHMSETQKVGILYLFCSQDAMAEDGRTRRLTENFEVTPRLARRFNFWRRIYSLWTKDNYVLHISRYPEVVLEAYDGSRLGDHMGPVTRERAVKKVVKLQRAKYKTLLREMHRNRTSPERFTPAMKRLADQMAHIKDEDKYQVASFSLRLQRGQRDFIAKGLRTAGRYLPAIEKEFLDIGVPVELSRIAFVESSFNLLARSKVGASGVYQIMPSTGRQYLKLFSGVDERNDPIKASRAAAKLFKLNYRLLGKWPLAVTAYNHGVGGVRKAVRRTGTNQLEDLIDQYQSRSFGFASKNFFASYLAVMATIKDAETVFPEIPAAPAISYDEHRLSSAVSIRKIRGKYGVSNDQIKEYNPDIAKWFIRSGGVLPRGYRLKVPATHEVKAVPMQ